MPLVLPFTSLPLSLVLPLISIHYTCSTGSNPCASSSSCGHIDVSYPFSLIDPHASSDSSYSYCGYPGLQISCYKYNQYSVPVLFLGSDNYTVNKISYDTKTISLVDSDILLQTTSNPRVDHNVSLTPNIWLNYTILVINITFLLNCPQIPIFASNAITPAPVGTTPGNYAYVFPTAALPSYYNEGVNKCKEVVIAPVLGYKFNAQLSNMTSNYASVLRDGFELEWGNYTSKSNYCIQCEKGGGQCGYNVASNSNYTFTCFCSNHSCIM